ncbi:DNA cytosine methyltransferase [Citrobacter koseri]|nr:DNA cytosine methyltransferase [Citrobacter koseri]HEM6716967.1 DNA cytosine methyltransferase [Citrobacter koseri]
MTKYRVADLFSGAGGLSLGFQQAGFNITFAADNDRDALDTYIHNFGPHAYTLDLTEGSPETIAAHILNTAGEIDLLIGGPPCQGFSIQRRGAKDDQRNHLLLKHVQIGLALSAKAILIENVPTILGNRGLEQLNEVFSLLSNASYSVTTKVLLAADYGVPQLRRRAFIVAFRKDFPHDFQFEQPSYSPQNYMTVRQAISDLPALPSDHSAHPDIANHQRRNISEINLKRLSYVPEGGGRLDIPEELRLPCHMKDNGHRHLDVYGRMFWDKPAPTITAMFDNFTRGRFAHPSETRNISNREGARLQSFPDSFIFLGNQKSVARQIGNAVPPILAEAVARSILCHLDSKILGQQKSLKRSHCGVKCIDREVTRE